MNPSPDADGMVRCQDCLRTVPVTRTNPFNDQKTTRRGCGAQPLRPVLVADKWRRCELFRPRSSREGS